MMKSIASLICICFVLPLTARADLVWDFNFDASVPAAARTSTIEAANHISSLISGPFNATLVGNISFENLGQDVLGGATPQFADPFTSSPGFGNLPVPMSKALHGVDTNGAGADVVVEIGNSIDWGYSSSTINPNETSFFDTMVHELVHSIGFLELANQAGNGLEFGTPGTVAGHFAPYDRYLGDGGGPEIIDPTTFRLDKARWDAAVVGGTGTAPPTSNTGLYFYGPNARAANGGNPVPLYSPSTYEPGSSVGHLDTLFFPAESFIMLHAAAQGELVGTLKPLELAIMKDIGFSVVPEPSAFLMIGFIGGALFASKKIGAFITN